MGAVAPLLHWKPEDDLLLKNAVEAGASLESLAKGAVRFSRRFTVQELQDRWHSLLYDPSVSAEASARMVEYEHLSLSLQSNSSQFDSAKETKDLPRKRKADSIHRRYTAMRKRILSETIDSVDRNFLAAPGVINCGNGHEPPASNQPHGQIPADCMYQDPVCDNFGIQESSLEVPHHAFPNLGDGGFSAAANDVDNASPFCTSHDLSLAQNSVDQNICPPLEENFSCERAQYKVEEFGQLKELPVSDLFEAEDLRSKQPSVFCQVVDSDGIPFSDCETSFHNIGYPSPLSEAPVWSTTEDISAPNLPELDFGGKQDPNDSFPLPDNGGNPSTSGYGTLDSNSNLNNLLAYGNVENLSPKAAKIIAELSDRLMDSSDQDDLFDTVDKSYLDDLGSLLLDSPNKSDMPIVCASKASVAPDEYLNIASGELPGELGKKGFHQCSESPKGCTAEEKLLPSALFVYPDFPERRNGVICCTLNTEDPDIPSNDDVFLPVRLSPSSLSSLADWRSHEAHYPTTTSVRDIPSHQKASHGGSLMMKRERSNYNQAHISSNTTGLSRPSETGLNLAFHGHGTKLELPQDDALNGARTGAISQGPSESKSTNGNANSSLGVPIKGKSINSEHAKNDNHHPVGSYLENQVTGHVKVLGFCTSASSSKLEADAPVMPHNELVLKAKLGFTGLTVPKLDVSPALSDKEECPSENEEDVPSFSDVEAMVLDMDLSPDDQDLCSNVKVLTYQQKESKRIIIRLEQAADAYMRRAMEANGAFAVLYGRHSKHFIKKPEVLIGRATEDFKVDIDLGREGRVNKISRRQAIIKLGMAGSFCLKNFGKYSIYVNGKEVASSHSQILTSGCLIEVRDMAFLFETNQTRIKQHMDKVTRGISQMWERRPIIH